MCKLLGLPCHSPQTKDGGNLSSVFAVLSWVCSLFPPPSKRIMNLLEVTQYFTQDANGTSVRWRVTQARVPQGDVCWVCGQVCDAWAVDGFTVETCVRLLQNGDIEFTGGFKIGRRVFLAARHENIARRTHRNHLPGISIRNGIQPVTTSSTFILPATDETVYCRV